MARNAQKAAAQPNAAPKPAGDSRPRHAPRQATAARVLELAECGCTVEEIAAEMGCAPEKLRAQFGPQLRQGLARLRAQLRRLLLDSAQEGKVPAQVWLGRLYLGRVEEQRADDQPATPRKPLCDMTTSEMLEDYMSSRAKERSGAG